MVITLARLVITAAAQRFQFQTWVRVAVLVATSEVGVAGLSAAILASDAAGVPDVTAALRSFVVAELSEFKCRWANCHSWVLSDLCYCWTDPQTLADPHLLP